MKKYIFSIVPRVNKDSNEIELYYLDFRNQLTCFCKSEGHNYADLSYYHRKTRKPQTEKEIKAANNLISFYATIEGETDCIEVQRKRLRSVKVKTISA